MDWASAERSSGHGDNQNNQHSLQYERNMKESKKDTLEYFTQNREGGENVKN